MSSNSVVSLSIVDQYTYDYRSLTVIQYMT